MTTNTIELTAVRTINVDQVPPILSCVYDSVAGKWFPVDSTAGAIKVAVISGGGGSGIVSVSNFPASFGSVQSGVWGVGVTNFPATQAVTGTFFQATQPVSGTFFQAIQPVSGTISVGNFPATQAVSGPLTDTQLRASAVPVSLASTTVTGSVAVTGTFWQATQPISLATNTPTLQAGSTTTVTQATGTNLHTVIDSGTNPIGKVAVDQTTNIIAGTTMQNSAVAIGNGVNLNVQGYVSAIISITGVMGANTAIAFEASADDITFVPISGHQIGLAGNLTSTTTNIGDFRFNVASYKSIRARISVFGSGTVTAKGYVSALAGHSTTVNANIIASLPTGTNSIGFVGLTAEVPNTVTNGTFTASDVAVNAPVGDGTLVTGLSTAGSIVYAIIPDGFQSWTLLIKGYVSGAIYTEASNNTTNGTDGDWVEVKGRRTGTAPGTESVVYAMVANGYYRGNGAGFKAIRARLIGGVGPTIQWQLSNGQGATFLNSGIPGGSSVIGGVTQSGVWTIPIPVGAATDANLSLLLLNQLTVQNELLQQVVTELKLHSLMQREGFGLRDDVDNLRADMVALISTQVN